MIKAVSPVSFQAAAPVDPISRPGKYTMQPKEVVAPEKKDHKALKWIAGITVGALAVCGLLIAGNKQGWFTKLADDAFKEASVMEKGKHYLWKAGDFLTEKAWKPAVKFVTETVPNKCKEVWAKVKAWRAGDSAQQAAQV